MRVWINFEELRSRLNAEAVLGFYKVEVHRKGVQHTGDCPLPKHTAKQSKGPPFSMNLERGIFQCFGCGAKGNILDFAGLMEGADLKDGKAVREVAVKLQQQFFPDGASTQKNHKQGTRQAQRPTAVAQPEQEQQEFSETTRRQPSNNVVVNAPLDFELQGLDAVHPFLADTFSPETIKHFGLGYCSRGLLKSKIAIPVRDLTGHTVGYVGREPNEENVSEKNPRYRFPPDRDRDGVTYQFEPGRILYNAVTLSKPADELILVDDFDSAWWLHELGRTNVVATMSPECSEEQAHLLVQLLSPRGRLWILPRGGKEGEWLANFVLLRVSAHRFTRWLRVEADKAPYEVPANVLNSMFTV